MSFNHVIDPTYFYDAVALFAFTYTFYVCMKKGLNDYGQERYDYKTSIITGSLQIQGINEHQSLTGTTNSVDYKFYCISKYQINIGDVIEYEDKYLRVNNVMPYNEYGVRQASLTMIQLTAYRDFADYIYYIKGLKTV